VNDDEKRAIFQELLDAAQEKTRADFPQPNMTVNEYLDLLDNPDLTKTKAYNALERKVQGGTLKKAKVQVGDQSCNIYWKA
jgi:hypothetical protein